MRFRAELRSRWRTWLTLAVLAGIAGGLVIAGIAGARRTDSALARHLDAYRFPTRRHRQRLGRSQPTSDRRFAQVGALPHVQASALDAELSYCARDAQEQARTRHRPAGGAVLGEPRRARRRRPAPAEAPGGQERQTPHDRAKCCSTSRAAQTVRRPPGRRDPDSRVPFLWRRAISARSGAIRRTRTLTSPVCRHGARCGRSLSRVRSSGRATRRRRSSTGSTPASRRALTSPGWRRSTPTIPAGKAGGRSALDHARPDRRAVRLDGLPAPYRRESHDRSRRSTAGTSSSRFRRLVPGGRLVRLKVVGVEATTDPYPIGKVLLTPAFDRVYGFDSRYFDSQISVRLRHGAADLPAFREEVLRLGARIGPGGTPV